MTHAASRLRSSLLKAPLELSELAVIGSAAARVWPGRLLDGRALQRGCLRPIDLHASPGTITVSTDFGAAVTTSLSQSLDRPGAESIRAAREALLARLDPVTSPGAISACSALAESVTHGLLQVGVAGP